MAKIKILIFSPQMQASGEYNNVVSKDYQRAS